MEKYSQDKDDVYFHAILSVLTCGLWLPFWGLIWISEAVTNWFTELIGAILEPIFKLLIAILVMAAKGVIALGRRLLLAFSRPRA
jgi:hypothetical protein